ncbi:MAG: hypothetical protein AMXMBFR61_13390 [Fimbriimonadales bacterium]
MKLSFAPLSQSTRVALLIALASCLLVSGCRGSSPNTSAEPKGRQAATTQPAGPPTGQAAGAGQTSEVVRLRFELPPDKPIKYDLTSRMFVSEGAGGSETSKLQMTSTTVAVQSAKRADKSGIFPVEVRFQSPKATVERGGQADVSHARMLEERLRSQVQVYRFDSRGRIHLGEGDEVPFEVGLNGLVFPEGPVGVGATWTHSCKLNLAKIVEAGAPTIPVTAKFRLLELSDRKGSRQAKVRMAVDAAVAEDSPDDKTIRYSGTVKLSEDAWVEVETGIIQSAESKIDVQVSKLQGGTLRTFVRTAEQTMVRRP